MSSRRVGTRGRNQDEDAKPTGIGSSRTRRQNSPLPGTSASARRRQQEADDIVNEFLGVASQSQRSTRSQKRGTQSQAASQSQTPRNKSQNRNRHRDDNSSDENIDFQEGQLTHDEKIKNCVTFMLVMQKKLHPVRKSELIKNAMNKQAGEFGHIMEDVKEKLSQIFGLKLIGLKNGVDGNFEICPVSEAACFILVSKFRQLTPTQFQYGMSQKDKLTRAALYVILQSVYMLDKDLDEDSVWEILESLEFSENLCKRREDLRRFLKAEFVDTLFLSKHEERDVDQVTVTYGWGLRSVNEFSKYAMLKFVAQCLGKRPDDFLMHYSKLGRKQIEKVDEEDEGMKRVDLEENEDDEETDVEGGGNDVVSSKTKRIGRVISSDSDSSD